MDIEEILKIQNRDVLGEITQSNTDIAELKNNASIVNLTATGDARFNSDVSFIENLDIQGILKIQDRNVLGEKADINGRVVELEAMEVGDKGEVLFKASRLAQWGY